MYWCSIKSETKSLCSLKPQNFKRLSTCRLNPRSFFEASGLLVTPHHSLKAHEQTKVGGLTALECRAGATTCGVKLEIQTAVD